MRDESEQEGSPEAEAARTNLEGVAGRFHKDLRQRVEEAHRAGSSLPEAVKEHLGAPQITPEHAEALYRMVALVQSMEPEEHPARAALDSYLDALNTLLDAQEELREVVAEHIPDPLAD